MLLSAHKIKAFILLQLMLLSCALSGCKDDFTIGEIGEGEATIACEVNFVPLVNALSSRSAGNAIKNINTLDVLIYDNSETPRLVKHYKNLQTTGIDWRCNQSGNSNMPTGSVNSGTDDNTNASYSDPKQAEATTPRATFTLPDRLPYGRYKIYAVANTTISDEVAEDIDAVKSLLLTWEPDNIASNNAMFGYFTTQESSNSGADKFDAPTLIVNQQATKLHSWIKRAASKLTIAFDGSGLNNDVHVYIKSVTLKNIPMTCYLGKVNSPDITETTPASDLFFNPQENFLPEKPTDPSSLATEEGVVANSRFFYNSEIKGIYNTSDQTTDPGTDYNKWMEVINSGGNKGIYGSSHSESADALYFYENNQGDYEGEFPYDKRQYKYVDGADNSNTVGENITNPTQTDYRDKVPEGTFVEVQAFYISENPANFTSGPIRYRFMLGKNITYNYNAERNHHFKLTLGFKGWANQPDWHIEYDEPEPSLIVPETFRVSYVYNQSHTLPIRVIGDCESVEMEIVKNYWAPCDDQGNTLQTAGSTNPNDPTAFRWAKSVFDDQLNGNTPTSFQGNIDFNCTGFLALQVNHTGGNIDTNIIDDNFSEGYSALKKLSNYYFGVGEGVDQHLRTFRGSQLNEGFHGTGTVANPMPNDYQVNVNGIKDFTMLVPVYTRNKSMINGSNYSGNNPFEEYDRYAEIKVTAKFSGGKPDIVKTVKVLQTRRLVNPKGIWRRHTNDTGDFHVQLATKAIGAAYTASYQPLQSDGSWTAYIDNTEGNDFFQLKTSMAGDTTQYVVYDASGNYAPGGKGTKIIGKTDTFVDFYVDFGNATSSRLSNCGIITVLYHQNNCVHKIMVRQGFNEPLAVVDGGAEWSSFSVYGATPRTNSANNFDVELTKNPLALGSLIRRGSVDKAILVSNNGGVDVEATNFSDFPMPFGAFKPVPFNQTLEIYSPADASGNRPSRRAYWGDPLWDNSLTGDKIGFTNDLNTTNGMGLFHAVVNNVSYEYRVPTFADFKQLDNSEYAYGVCYGAGASKTQMDPDNAFGFIDPENDDNEEEGTTMGMRGIFVYNPNNGNQIFFPIGKYGIGRRRMFNLDDVNELISAKNTKIPQTVTGYKGRSWIGTLWYGDTNSPLPIARTDPGWFRPMAYNVCYQQGAIYWIDKFVPRNQTGTNSSSLGWDMNYYGFDFSAYTSNNYQDACIIKLVVNK